MITSTGLRTSRVYFRHPGTGCTAIVQQTHKLVNNEWLVQVVTVCDGRAIYASRWHKKGSPSSRRAYKRSTSALAQFEVLTHD